MANKFTKSVLERQQKEYTSKAPTPQAVPDSTPTQTPPEPDVTAIKQTPVPVPESSSPAPVLPDLDSFLVQGQERSAKNKTFYLDTAVIHAIKSAAASRKVTESKLVNDILKKILSVEN